MSDPNYNERLKTAFVNFIDCINELGEESRIPAIARTQAEIAFRIARDYNNTPAVVITGATPEPIG